MIHLYSWYKERILVGKRVRKLCSGTQLRHKMLCWRYSNNADLWELFIGTVWLCFGFDLNARRKKHVSTVAKRGNKYPKISWEAHFENVKIKCKSVLRSVHVFKCLTTSVTCQQISSQSTSRDIFSNKVAPEPFKVDSWKTSHFRPDVMLFALT